MIIHYILQGHNGTESNLIFRGAAQWLLLSPIQRLGLYHSFFFFSFPSIWFPKFLSEHIKIWTWQLGKLLPYFPARETGENVDLFCMHACLFITFINNFFYYSCSHSTHHYILVLFQYSTNSLLIIIIFFENGTRELGINIKWEIWL